jgi:O-antigen/teichoic acid export membrane protein
MGLELAGIYLFGQRKFSLQTVFSNSFSWTVLIAAGCLALVAASILADETILGMDRVALSVALAGACLIMITDGAGEYLLPLGRVRAYTFVKIVVPIVRLAGIAGLALAVGLSVRLAAGIWLGSFAVGSVITVYFLLRHVRVIPGINLTALRQQASFGARSHFGWVLQAMNHRLDVFLVGCFVGTAGVGHYLVGVNLAELGWWIPITLGSVLFPKVAAMAARDNFELSAAACRRTLALTALAIAGLLLVARPMIPVVYGAEFGPSVAVFMILLPSGLFYTVHKVLGSSLSASGKPQVTVYSGIVSLPATVGLNLLLFRPGGSRAPRWLPTWLTRSTRR